MKKTNLLTCLFVGAMVYGQVGIHTSDPKVTLDVMAKKSDGTTSEGFLAPRLTGESLYTADLNGVYAQPQDGTLVYVTAPTLPAHRIGQTIDIDAKGLYYYESSQNKWIKAFVSNSTGTGLVSTLACNTVMTTGSLNAATTATGVNASVSYTGGDGGTYGAQSVESTGVTGLTAKLSAGVLLMGPGTVTYAIEGVPAAAGVANFSISLGGKSCIFTIEVGSSTSVVMCGSSLPWATHNVGADTSFDPNVPVKEIHGNYYQWGRSTAVANADTPPGAISGWSTAIAPNGSWNLGTEATPVKNTANDPCPAGYRVPTRSEWVTLYNNSAKSRVGPFTANGFDSALVLTCGVNKLTFPAAGYRHTNDGTLANRGSVDYYWSSTESGASNAYHLIYNGTTGNPESDSFTRRYAMPVRCVLFNSTGTGTGDVSTLDCNNVTTTGSLIAGLQATNVISSVPYTGGNGGTYNGQSVMSTGVQGLTANLAPGTLNNNTGGNLTYTITGSPLGTGMATFPISIGGKSCSINLNISNATTTLASGKGSFKGKMCFDVVMSNDGGDCGTLLSRQSQKADFSQTATNTQTYTFTPPAGAVSNVRFIRVNNNNVNVITSISGGNPGNYISATQTATVTFNPDLNSLAKSTDKLSALTANVIVIYNNTPNNTGTDVQLALTIKVQDCVCCGAYTAPNVWKDFMCHNLGADESADPLVPAAAIHGAKYQWGRPAVALSQTADQASNAAVIGWNLTPAADNSWSPSVKTDLDPCPPGYKVPSIAQLTGVKDYNPTVRLGTWVETTTNYDSAIKFGTSLLLPAAGQRNAYGAFLFDGNGKGGRNVGLYWAADQGTGPYAYTFYFTKSVIIPGPNGVRYHGASLRCIAEQ